MIPNLENSTFSGSETITLKPLEETTEIIFHLKNMSVNEHSISLKSTKENANSTGITEMHYLDGSKYRIVLSDPMNTEETYNLYLSFTGHLNNQLQGFFKTHYSDGRSER